MSTSTLLDRLAAQQAAEDAYQMIRSHPDKASVVLLFDTDDECREVVAVLRDIGVIYSADA